LDTEQTHESLYEWLKRRGLPGLPAEPRHQTSAQGEGVLHHPNGCHYQEWSDLMYAERRPGPEGTPGVCGCLFRDSLQGTTEKEFLRQLGPLMDLESVFQRSVHQDPYRLNGAFPQLRALTVHHHRRYAENGYLSRGILDGTCRTTPPALRQVGEHLAREWDAAITANPLDQALLNEEIVRYAVRYLMSRTVLEKTAGLQLPLMNALQDIVWQWLSRPLDGTLLEEYFSERGDTLRKHACHPLTGSRFRMKLLDELQEDARAMFGRDTMVACHLGGPETKVFEVDEGIRPVIVWNGIRAKRNDRSTGLGEYPQIVCEWFSRQDTERKQKSMHAPPGGAVIPICNSPGLDQLQWETALLLWDESFNNGKDDPGPYRSQKTAIITAANL